MASVHLAYDTVLDRQVAIKTLHTELGREQSFRERFRREAQSVAKLTHTNIVSVFDSGEDELDGALMPYIVMEYVEGQPLRSVLDEDIAQLRRDAGRQGAEDHRRRAGGARGQPRDGPGPPGHQARQRDDDQARRGQGHGLRHRPRHAVRRDVDDPDRHGRRHPAVPLARAGPGPRRRRPLRPVLGRHHALRAAHRPAALRRGLPAGHRLRARPGGAGRAVHHQPLAPPGGGRAGRPGAEEEPQRAVPHRRRDARRVRRVSRPGSPAPPHHQRRPTGSGAGVGSAVFPPLDQHTPAPASRPRTSRSPTATPAPRPLPTPGAPTATPSRATRLRHHRGTSRTRTRSRRSRRPRPRTPQEAAASSTCRCSSARSSSPSPPSSAA